MRAASTGRRSSCREALLLIACLCDVRTCCARAALYPAPRCCVRACRTSPACRPWHDPNTNQRTPATPAQETWLYIALGAAGVVAALGVCLRCLGLRRFCGLARCCCCCLPSLLCRACHCLPCCRRHGAGKGAKACAARSADRDRHHYP